MFQTDRGSRVERSYSNQKSCIIDTIFRSNAELLQSRSRIHYKTHATKLRYASNDATSTEDAEKKPIEKPKKVTTLSIASKKRRGERITMVTAYDYPSAVHVDRAGVDVLLVGDSCAMVELGFETTQVCVWLLYFALLQKCSVFTCVFNCIIFKKPITLEQMIHHCSSVKRGAPNRPLLVGDMPFGSYEYKDVDIALKNSYRMLKEGGMDAVKFEGGSKARANIVKHVVEGGGEFFVYMMLV